MVVDMMVDMVVNMEVEHARGVDGEKSRRLEFQS